MSRYLVIVSVPTTTYERYEIEVEADDPGEAQALAEEAMLTPQGRAPAEFIESTKATGAAWEDAQAEEDPELLGEEEDEDE